MTQPVPDDRAILQLADELASLKGRVDLLQDGTRASQLKYSSIENGSIAVFDAAGLERLRLGLQPDGSFTSDSKNNPDPPPVPRVPLLTAGKGTIKIQSQGSVLDDASWPKDFSHLRVYALIGDGPAQFSGTIAVDPGVYVLGPLDYVPVTIWFTAINHSGKESAASEAATATPERVVGTDVLDGAITSLQLADEAVTRAKVAVGAISELQLDDDAVTNDKIAAHSIDGEQIRANTITALNLVARTITGLQIEVETILGENIVGRSVTADKLVALSISANEIAANAVTAAKILTGSITADKLEAVLILATQIIAGDPTGARVAIDTSGINAFNLGGERTFQVNAQTGDVKLVGTLETGLDGSIVRITPGDPSHPLQTPGVFIYADGSNFPALIYATPAGNALGVRPSALQIIASLDDTGAAGHLSLRDIGAQLQYSRMFTTGTLNDLKAVGGSFLAGPDVCDMRVLSGTGSLATDGGFVTATRTDAQFGFFKSASVNALLTWGQNARLSMFGKLQANHGDIDFGIFTTIFTASGSGNLFNIPYGSTDPNFTGRIILMDWEATAQNFCWVTTQSATGCTIRINSTIAGSIHFASIGIGV